MRYRLNKKKQKRNINNMLYKSKRVRMKVNFILGLIKLFGM